MREKSRDQEGGGLLPRMQHTRIFTIFTLAPAHLEIRFNSLNFKILSPLSLVPSANRAVPDPLSLFFFFPSIGSPLCLCLYPTDHSVPFSFPKNKIALLLYTGDKVLDTSRHADPRSLRSPFGLQLATCTHDTLVNAETSEGI